MLRFSEQAIAHSPRALHITTPTNLFAQPSLPYGTHQPVSRCANFASQPGQVSFTSEISIVASTYVSRIQCTFLIGVLLTTKYDKRPRYVSHHFGPWTSYDLEKFAVRNEVGFWANVAVSQAGI